MMPESPKHSLTDAVRKLRLALGDTQQDFAHRLGLAISTVVRYELTRPPKGKALALFERIAAEHSLDELADVFRQALAAELGGDYTPRQPATGSGEVLYGIRPRNEEEEALHAALQQVLSHPDEYGKEIKSIHRTLSHALEVVKQQHATLYAQNAQGHAIVRMMIEGKSNEEIAAKLKAPKRLIEGLRAIGAPERMGKR